IITNSTGRTVSRGPSSDTAGDSSGSILVQCPGWIRICSAEIPNQRPIGCVELILQQFNRMTISDRADQEEKHKEPEEGDFALSPSRQGRRQNAWLRLSTGHRLVWLSGNIDRRKHTLSPSIRPLF